MAERRLAVALAGVLLAVTGCASASDDAGEGELRGSPINDPWPAPATELRDAGGAAYSFTEQTDKPLTLVFFGYTNCPEICSQVMANVTTALVRLDEDQRQDVEVVFVTTDPARDDAASLTRYLGAFDEDYVGLTGDLADIEQVAQDFHVFFAEGRRLRSGGYDVLHDDHVFVVDAADEIPLFWRRTVAPADIAADLQTLLEKD